MDEHRAQQNDDNQKRVFEGRVRSGLVLIQRLNKVPAHIKTTREPVDVVSGMLRETQTN